MIHLVGATEEQHGNEVDLDDLDWRTVLGQSPTSLPVQVGLRTHPRS